MTHNFTELISPIPVHLNSLIPRMSTFTLVISCLATSNLPWFMDLTFQVPMQYCFLQHQTFTSITSHIHNWVLFLLWLHLFILSVIISPLISSSMFGTLQPGKFIFQCPIFLPFHTIHGILNSNGVLLGRKKNEIPLFTTMWMDLVLCLLKCHRQTYI